LREASDGKCDKNVTEAVDVVLRDPYAASPSESTWERTPMPKVEVSNDELRTVRDAMRELNRMVEQLERRQAEKYVLTKHGQMRAVVVSVEHFAELRRRSQAA